MTSTLKEPAMRNLPGRPDAVRDGCTCRPSQRAVRCRDGWGFDVDDNCPLHGHWGELAE